MQRYYINSAKKLISNRDLFGQSVELNMNQNGKTLKTVIGGITSVLIQLVLLSFAFLKLRQFLGSTQDVISMEEQSTQFESIGTVTLKEANIMPYFVISKSVTLKPITITEEVAKNIVPVFQI